jgi:hypothetical protein
MPGRWPILAVTLIALVNAVGCGGSDHERVNPEAMLDSAAAHSIRIGEAEISLRMRLEGVPQLSDPITLRLEGPYVGGGARIPSFEWRLSASALGFPVGGRLVSTRDNVYLTVYGNRYEFGAAEVAAANRRIAAARALPLSFRGWLGRGRVTGEGDEGGVDCERIQAPLRGTRMERDLAPLAAELGLSAPAISGRATACVGFDDRVLHGLEVDAVLAPSPADSARLGGATAIQLGADVVLSDVGEPQRIEAPGGSFRPIRDLFLTINDLAG